MTFWNMYIIIIVSFLVILFLGLIFLLSQCVTSRYISKPCPTKSYSVDSSIKAANITKEEIAKNLQFRLNLFRNATQKLIEKYVSTFCWCFFLSCKVICLWGFCFCVFIKYKWETLRKKMYRCINDGFFNSMKTINSM